MLEDPCVPQSLVFSGLSKPISWGLFPPAVYNLSQNAHCLSPVYEALQLMWQVSPMFLLFRHWCCMGRRVYFSLFFFFGWYLFCDIDVLHLIVVTLRQWCLDCHKEVIKDAHTWKMVLSLCTFSDSALLLGQQWCFSQEQLCRLAQRTCT